MIRRTFRASMAVILAGALAISGGVAARAEDAPRERVGDYRLVRLCDPTVCYIAWRIIDSDNDGVSDADETQAGTDPQDPNSRPELKLIAELLIARQLPSFEYGLGTLLAIPAEIIALREKIGFDPLGAMPLGKRADTLTRLGISGDLLAQMGISPDRSGFSLGLDSQGTGGGSGLPSGIKVAGLDASLISAGSPSGHASRGGITETYKNWFGETVTVFGDGSKDTTRPIDHGTTTTTTNADGSKGNTVTKDGGSRKEGGTTVVVKNETTTNAAGTVLSSSSSISYTSKGGSTTVLTTTTESILDNDGNVVGVIITESQDNISADGNSSSHQEARKVCDANGKNCSNWDYNDEYVDDPDHAYQNIVTQEVVNGVIRTRGAAVRVVEGWTTPEMGNDPKNPRDLGTIMLVDDTAGDMWVLTEPKVVTAQPEKRPELPNPQEHFAGPPSGGGCQGLC